MTDTEINNAGRPVLVAVGLCLAMIGILTAMADEWPAPKTATYKSANGEYVFVAKPRSRALFHAGHCRGTLYRVTRGRHQEIWSRLLINNVAPRNVYVSDSGNYIVTTDEHGRVGLFPLVIYGKSAQIIQAHDLESLRLDFEIMHYESSVSSDWWSVKAELIWGPREETFLVKLGWGKILVFQTATGQLLNTYEMIDCRYAKVAVERGEKPKIEKYADELAASASAKYRELAKQLREQNKAYGSPKKR